KNLIRNIKVAENPAYHPVGQFGTCLHGGNGAASTRYIFTRICPFAVSLFNNDELVLTYLNEDGMSIESE
ncbi:unnamed protein product, partial [Rotaria magnacalcarata]